MADTQSDEISMPEVSACSMIDSTKSLFAKDSKKKFSVDFWWKVTITLAVIIIACFMIYQAVADEQKSSIKTNLSSASSEQNMKYDKDGEESNMECKYGSIKNSHASFTYQPYNSTKPYTTKGLEFSFEDIKKKLGVEPEMIEFHEEAHYYYNIRRCEIGGKVQIDKEPIIRGPIVFAIDDQCTKVYYFSQGWKEYASARNIHCYAHGIDIVHVEESDCLKGSIKNSNSSFVYVPLEATKPYRTIGVEFSFEMIAKKTKLGARLKKLNKLIASTSKVHYYYNIPRCRIGGKTQLDKEPIIRGPLFFAVDEQCSKTYYFIEGRGWIQYISATNISCSNHGNSNSAKCFQNSFETSYIAFSYYSGTIKKQVDVTGIQYNFTKLVEKLEYLTTDYNLTKIPELSTAQGKVASYYLNLHRCYNGGPHNLYAKPPVGGASILAVNDDCSKVFYLSSSDYQWKSYASAANIKCRNRQKN